VPKSFTQSFKHWKIAEPRFFSRLILFSSKVFFETRKKGKKSRGQDLANKEVEEAQQRFPVSDILVQLPLCVTKHCHVTT
jgi:hypothetical protein